MKYIVFICLFWATLTVASAQEQRLPGQPVSESFSVTPIGENTGVTVRKVSFLRSNNILLVGNLFLPNGFDTSKRYPAIISVHPAGSVKEQSSGLYAYLLAQQGFVTLAFDATYAGESGGIPRWSEAPYERVEDIRYAVDYLVTLPFVNERRIRAIAGVSAADIGAANRESWLRGRSVEEQIAILEDVSAQRTREARGEELMKVYMCPEPTYETAPSFREGYDYYRTARAFHPRADNFYLRRSQATKMAFSAIENVNLLTQPVLLVVGEQADSKWQTKRFYDALPGKDKEVFTIPDCTHIELYDKLECVNPAVKKLSEFFVKALSVD